VSTITIYGAREAGTIAVKDYEAGTIVATQPTAPPAPTIPAWLTHAWEAFRLSGVGSPVTTIPDTVGSVDLQSAGTARGILRNDGSHNYIEMDKVDDEYYTGSNVDWTAGFTWFVVVRTDALTNYRMYSGLGASGASAKAALFSSSGGSVALQRRNPSFQNCASSNGAFPVSTNSMITVDSGGAELWIGRTSVATSAPFTIPSADVYAIGRPYAIIGTGRLGGRLYAAYKAPASLTTPQREEMWTYIEAALSGSL